MCRRCWFSQRVRPLTVLPCAGQPAGPMEYLTCWTIDWDTPVLQQRHADGKEGMTGLDLLYQVI